MRLDIFPSGMRLGTVVRAGGRVAFAYDAWTPPVSGFAVLIISPAARRPACCPQEAMVGGSPSGGMG